MRYRPEKSQRHSGVSMIVGIGSLRTAENPEKANFKEPPTLEVRRKLLLGPRVSKGKS